MAKVLVEERMVKDKIISLYSLETDTDAVISELFHPRCAFRDPLVSVRGHKEVKAQFRILRTLLWKCRLDVTSAHYDENIRTLTIDSMLTFKPRFWVFSGFKVKNFTVVNLDRHGLVRSHTDHWSIASLLEMRIGWLYNAVRRAFGFATSALISWLIVENKTSKQVTAEGEPIGGRLKGY